MDLIFSDSSNPIIIFADHRDPIFHSSGP